MQTRLRPLEFALFRMLQGFRGSALLLAVSGGCDSVVLLHAIAALRERLELRLGVAHVHHGVSRNEGQTRARNQAAAFVQDLAQKLQIQAFMLGGMDNESRESQDANRLNGGESEEQLRLFRLEKLEACRLKHGFSHIVFAHHRQDLLETRMIRLLRGTGPDGLVAMRPIAETTFRPFLGETREAISSYARERNLAWLDDPSNQNSEPFRNWLRLLWLPELECKRPGSLESLARSFDLLVEALESQSLTRLQLHAACLKQNGIDRLLFDQLGIQERNYLIALYLRRLGARGLGRSHIEEIVKRLDSPQKSFRFEVGKFNWIVNAEQILAVPVSGDPPSTGL